MITPFRVLPLAMAAKRTMLSAISLLDTTKDRGKGVIVTQNTG
jgi:hypothetical protein